MSITHFERLWRDEVHAGRRIRDERDQERIEKNEAYRERDMCVALIAKLAAKLGYRVGIKNTEDAEWPIVFVDLPTGQVSWHIHNSEREWFASLPSYDGTWDGHSTEEKYKRVLECP